MNATNDNVAGKSLRRWWASPPRRGVQRFISPWEYRHLQAVAPVRFAAGGFQFGIGLVLLSLGRQAGTDAERRRMYRLSALFLLPAAGNFVGGYLDTTAARTAPPPTSRKSRQSG
jgi:hypothetical protein